MIVQHPHGAGGGGEVDDTGRGQSLYDLDARAACMFDRYAPQWNAIEAKLSDSVMLLTDVGERGCTWYHTTLGDLALPSSARRVVLLRRSSLLPVDQIPGDLTTSSAYKGPSK